MQLPRFARSYSVIVSLALPCACVFFVFVFLYSLSDMAGLWWRPSWRTCLRVDRLTLQICRVSCHRLRRAKNSTSRRDPDLRASSTERRDGAPGLRNQVARGAAGGQLLAEVEKAKSALGNQYTGPVTRHDRSTPATLDDLGISKNQSSQWQKLADVDEEFFEHAVKADRPTTSGIIAQTAGPREPRKNVVSAPALWFWGRLLDIERVAPRPHSSPSLGM